MYLKYILFRIHYSLFQFDIIHGFVQVHKNYKSIHAFDNSSLFHQNSIPSTLNDFVYYSC